jgi:hypothetical protein
MAPNPVTGSHSIHFDIIHPSMASLYNSGFPLKNVYASLSSLTYTTCPNHLILLDFAILTKSAKGVLVDWYQ